MTVNLIFKIVERNLVDVPTDALKNVVNSTCVMGKSVALHFKERFPTMGEPYRYSRTAEALQPRQKHIFDRGSVAGPNFFVHFPTNRDRRSASPKGVVETGCLALPDEIPTQQVYSVILAVAGSGDGGLAWQSVFSRILTSLGYLESSDVIVFAHQSHT